MSPAAPSTAGPSTAGPTPSQVSSAARSPVPSGPAGGPVPAGFVAASVTFISDRQGWILGTAPCAKQPCTSILRTTDGGASWRGVPAPRVSLLVSEDAAGSIDQLRFADPLDGFADGLGLWITHDGGASWQHQSRVAGIPGAVVTDLVATSSGVYALVSGTDSRYGGSDSHVRLVRADARISVFTVLADLGPSVSTGTLVSSGGTVYVTVTPISTGHVTTQLLRVKAGMVTRSQLRSQSCGQLAASTSAALLLECGQGVAQGAMGARSLFGSTDGGTTFHRLPDPGRGAGFDSSGIADAGNGHAVLGTSSGAGAMLLSTSDFARTWHAALSPVGEPYSAGFGDLGFEDTTHGVVIINPSAAAGEQSRYGRSAPPGTGTLYRTTDSGTTWNRMSFS